MAPYHPEAVAANADAPRVDDDERGAPRSASTLPEDATQPTARTLAGNLNAALADELLRRPEVLLFGEDVGRKGGVYNVTNGLQKRFGPARVFDTLLDETSILGIAQGAAQAGLLPIPEIQYLAYLHNALDQLRGEAASLQFFSSGQFRNPMVVRVAGLAYQKGFGGHFHNDNAIGALRDIPGLVLAVPSRGDDAVRMLRGAVAMAAEDGRVVVFLEPIALYHERDLHADGDGEWLTDLPDASRRTCCRARSASAAPTEDADLLIVSYANGYRLSLQAAARLRDEHDLRVRVLDLRWLNPLPTDAIRAHADEIGAVLVVDECRATGGGVADAIVADLAEHRIGRSLCLGACRRLVRAARARHVRGARRRRPDRRGRGGRRRRRGAAPPEPRREPRGRRLPRARRLRPDLARLAAGRDTRGCAARTSCGPAAGCRRSPRSTRRSASRRRSTSARPTPGRSPSWPACSTPSASRTTTRSWSSWRARSAGTPPSPPRACSASMTRSGSSRRWRSPPMRRSTTTRPPRSSSTR